MAVILTAVIICVVAGFINGSFATPTKYMEKWNEENIWFAFSFFGFLVLPIITLFVMIPNFLTIYSTLPHGPILIAILGGIGFGLGQVFFALAFRHIGIGLNFVINISMGTAGGALIPMLWNPQILGTVYSYVQILGMAIFVVAVIISAIAGKQRDASKGLLEDKKNANLFVGISFSILAGFGSMCQASTYAYSNGIIQNIAQNQDKIKLLPSGVIVWVFIFCSAFVPYALYFLIKMIKNNSFVKFKNPSSSIYWMYLLLMGIGFWGSVVLFARASEEIGGKLAPTIAWPLFMVFIILTSVFWSFKSGEWKGADKKSIKKIHIAILLLVGAVLVFACNSIMKPKTNKVVQPKVNIISTQPVSK